MKTIVQNQDSGFTKFEYTIIMTSLIEILITLLITSLMNINNVIIISLFSIIVVIINIVYWNVVKNKWNYLFED